MASWLSSVLSLFGDISLTMWLSTVLFTVAIVALFSSQFKRGRRLPPGPFSLPFIGHMLKQGLQPHFYYEKLRKKYGDIFGLYLGNRYSVIISGAKLVKETLLREEFMAKPPNMLNIEPYETINDLNGEDWKEQRKFFLKVFRSLGMGRSEGENAVQDQVSWFLDQLRNAAKQGDPDGIHIRDFLCTAVNNIIFTMLCNRNYQDDDKMKERMVKFSNETNLYFISQMLLYYMPWLKIYRTFKKDKQREDFLKCIKELEENIIMEEVKKHEKNYTGVENLDYLDFYIEQLRKPGAHKSYSRTNMVGSFEIMMIAASDTTRIMLEWYLHRLVKDQDIQERMYQEILRAVGKERLPQWDDRTNMPYLQAVLLEIQRIKTIIPVNLPRLLMEDVKLGGYDLLKGTLVTANFWSVHYDKEVWGDPENFRPERFLTEDGKGINTLEQYLATFSMGKRNCPGERLATFNLFLYLTAILQAFKIVPPKNGLNEDLSGAFGNEINLRIGLEPREA